MRTYIVTRHNGAVEWLKRKGYVNVQLIEHMCDSFINGLNKGDKVIGILPIPMMSKVCNKGAEFYHISITNLPSDKKGVELSANDLEEYGTVLQQYHVTRSMQQ